MSILSQLIYQRFCTDLSLYKQSIIKKVDLIFPDPSPEVVLKYMKSLFTSNYRVIISIELGYCVQHRQRPQYVTSPLRNVRCKMNIPRYCFQSIHIINIQNSVVLFQLNTYYQGLIFLSTYYYLFSKKNQLKIIILPIQKKPYKTDHTT